MRPVLEMTPCGAATEVLLPNSTGRAINEGMRRFAHRFLLLVAVVAFAAGVPLALAVPPAVAAEPCPHQQEQGMMMGTAQHHHHQPTPKHDHGAAACLCCCIGACVAIPDLARTSVVAIPVTMVSVVYPETAPALDGRSLRPEPAPPRTNALS